MQRWTCRIARPQDADALMAMQRACMRALSAGYYSAAEIEAYVGGVGTLDPRLIADRSYFLIEADGQPIGSGGWSLRTPHYAHAAANDAPAVAAATREQPDDGVPKLRGFFVHPDHARRGVGRAILQRVERAIRRACHNEIRLTAMLSGVAFYRAHGYRVIRRHSVDFGVRDTGLRADAVTGHTPTGVPVVDMAKTLRATRRVA